MPRSSKPRHKRKVRATAGNRRLLTQPWKTLALFRPLIAILDQLETEGTLDVIAFGPRAGTPIFRLDDDPTQWYEAAPALRGLIETFELHEQRTGRKTPLDPLRILVNKFEVDMPIFESDTQAVRTSIDVLRTEAHLFRADYASELVQVTQTAEQFERMKIAA